MKLRAIAALAATLASGFFTPAAAGNVNKDFIALSTISAMVILKCGESYEFIDNAARKSADRMGVDFDTFAPATMNAIFAIAEIDYDRNKLIPEVTQQVRSNLEELVVDLKKGSRPFCNRYGAVMVNVGWLRKK